MAQNENVCEWGKHSRYTHSRHEAEQRDTEAGLHEEGSDHGPRYESVGGDLI